ncbi:MAG: hypothetical protein WCQ95_02700 [Bacteroidota bacterium]
MKIKKTFILLLILFSFAGCRKKITPSWDVNVYAPLLNADLGVNNILPDSLLVYNQDNSLSLVYRYAFYNFFLDSLVSFPDTISHKYLPPLGGAIIPPGYTFFNFSENSELNIPNADIAQVVFRNGFLILEVFSTLSQNSFVTYKIPYATKNGIPFEITEEVPAAATGTTTHFLKKIDISGYSLDMRGPTHLSSNILTNTTIAKTDPSGDTLFMTVADNFSFNVRFDELSFNYAKGYFGSQNTVFGPDTSAIEMFNNVIAGSFHLESANLSLDVENGFGVDAQVLFNNITTANSTTGNAINLNDPIIGQTLNLSRATETFNPQAPVNPSTYHFSLNNSNIPQMIENMPNMISYRLQVTTNPLGNISSGNDFFYYGNYLNASLNLEIPLSIIANNLTLADTVPLDLGEPNTNPSSGKFKLIADNGFPFSADIQIYMLDANNHIYDSLLVPSLIDAPLLDANYMVVTPKRSELEIILPENKYMALYNTRKVWVKARFNTAGASNFVKIYSFYKLKLKLTGDFSYLVEM